MRLDQLREDFFDLRDSEKGKERIKGSLVKHEGDIEKYLSRWMAFSKDSDHVYPSQGLLTTPHDYIDYKSVTLLPHEEIVQTLRLRWFFLTMFNHPYRMHFLKNVQRQKFSSPPKIDTKVFEHSKKNGLTLSVGDLGARVTGSSKPRSSRNARYAQGPFVKLGRQARCLFVGSASPDVWNSAAAISTMAASHCLATVPRNGVTSDVDRQTDLAREVFEWLEHTADALLTGRRDKRTLLSMWKNNVVGTLEANPRKALIRAKSLYAAGVRVFRVYSPEPGTGAIETLKALRRKYKDSVEIFVSMIIDVEQAKLAEQYGADGVYIGIGGGGRCITGVRSGSVVDWPELLWNLRGEINIPVIVEGGASDNVSVTLLLGANGIGVSRVVSGGTIESPGGALFCTDEKGHLFKPYGGEASARTKFLDQKLLPFNIPSFVEGETTRADKSYVMHVYPTLTYNLHLLIEDAILTMVFRNVDDIQSLQSISPSPLRRSTSFEAFQRRTH